MCASGSSLAWIAPSVAAVNFLIRSSGSLCRTNGELFGESDLVVDKILMAARELGGNNDGSTATSGVHYSCDVGGVLPCPVVCAGARHAEGRDSATRRLGCRPRRTRPARRHFQEVWAQSRNPVRTSRAGIH